MHSRSAARGFPLSPPGGGGGGGGIPPDRDVGEGVGGVHFSDRFPDGVAGVISGRFPLIWVSFWTDVP